MLSYVDSQIILIPQLPGIKLGLSNAVGLYLLYTEGTAKSALVTFVRVFLSALLFYPNFYHLAYGLTGASFALFMMFTVKKTARFGIVGVSIVGGVFHNIGQIAAVCFLTQTPQIAYYLPVLLVGGLLCGVLVGILGGIAVKRLQKAK